MSTIDRLMDAGCEDVLCFSNYSYDDALIGVTIDGRAVYDYNLMVDWLMKEEGWSDIDAIEWIEYNTIRTLPYMGAKAPIIMYSLEDLE